MRWSAARTKGWRCISGETEFLEPEEAVAEWNGGKLDGLVVPEDELTELLPRLPGAVPSRIGSSGPAGRYRRRYIFLVRSNEL